MSSRAPAVTQPSPNEAERAWAVTKDTTSPAVLQAYIKQFGATVYGNMARARLSELQAAAPKPPGKLAVASPAGSAPVQNKSSPSPPTINECETLVSTICGMWTFAGNNYIAQWQNGARAQLYVERFDDGGIVITRSDTSGISAGMTARYTGQPKGRGVIGEVIWIENGFSKKGTWNANW
jgi:hypothetical protein